MSYVTQSIQRKRKWSDVRAFYESGKASAETAAMWTGLPLREVQGYYDRRVELDEAAYLKCQHQLRMGTTS